MVRTGKRKTVSANLPFGWERHVLEDKKVVYVDNINKRTTFTDPRLAFAREMSSKDDWRGGGGGGFRQKHDASSSAGQVVHGLDLTGKIALVTGASGGIGYQTALALASQNCTVVLACRDLLRADKAANKIRSHRPTAQLDCLQLDLASFNSVKRFAAMVRMRYRKLDYLVLNAGVYLTSYNLTEDGFEEMMQVNYLSNFYLTHLLLSLLLVSPAPRVVTLTSESHRFSSLSSSSPPSSLHFSPGPGTFTPILQYNDSKLFCLLLSRGLHTQYHHKSLTSLAVHPGNLIPTDLHRHSTGNIQIMSNVDHSF